MVTSDRERMNLEIETVIQELQKQRPLFYSEADLQHALAWEIQRQHPLAAVRLEINQSLAGPREYLDILVKDRDTTCAIELKYKTGKLDAVYKGEEFRLLNQGAQDIGRYDFVKDIVRLERFVDAHPSAIGYAMFLTNCRNYWKETSRLLTADAMFRLHESRALNGELRRSEATGVGTMKGRESLLLLKGSHPIQWVDYSEVNGQGSRKFRYVLLKIARNWGQ
jgi:hypothetical protein